MHAHMLCKCVLELIHMYIIHILLCNILWQPFSVNCNWSGSAVLHWCSLAHGEVCRSTTASSFCQSHYMNQNMVEGWESLAINLLHAPFVLPTVWSVHTLFIATATLLVSSIPRHPFTLASINSITFPLSFLLNSSLFFPFFSSLSFHIRRNDWAWRSAMSPTHRAWITSNSSVRKQNKICRRDLSLEILSNLHNGSWKCSLTGRRQENLL